MQENAKQLAAKRALEFIGDARIVGLGTGSTAKYAIETIAEMVRSGAEISGVPTSDASAAMARQLGIPLVELAEVQTVDITIDGADEIDPAFCMIKGGGGALTREKLVALASRRRVYIVDETKLVDVLGRARPLPVEVLPFAWTMSARLIAELGCEPKRREQHPGNPFVTDNGNYILDCKFSSIPDPPATEARVKLIPGVVESGLFIDIADTVVVGFKDRTEVRPRK